MHSITFHTLFAFRSLFTFRSRGTFCAPRIRQAGFAVCLITLWMGPPITVFAIKAGDTAPPLTLTDLQTGKSQRLEHGSR